MVMRLQATHEHVSPLPAYNLRLAKLMRGGTERDCACRTAGLLTSQQPMS